METNGKDEGEKAKIGIKGVFLMTTTNAILTVDHAHGVNTYL